MSNTNPSRPHARDQMTPHSHRCSPPPVENSSCLISWFPLVLSLRQIAEAYYYIFRLPRNMGQEQSSAYNGRPKTRGSGAAKRNTTWDKLLSLPMLSTIGSVTGIVDTYTNFENGRAQRQALKEGIPAVKCFLSALTAHFQQRNYLELLSTFLLAMNTTAYWVEVLQGSSALEEIGRKIHGELEAQTGLMAAKLFAAQVDKTIRYETGSAASSDGHLYFLYHPDTDWHAEFFDRVSRKPLPTTFLGMSENLDSLVVWMLFLRQHLGQKKKKTWFHLIIPAYRPMLIKEPLIFPEELYPLSITGYIHDSKPYVWFDLPTVDDVPSDQFDIRHIGNLSRPPSAWRDVAVAGMTVGGPALTFGAVVGASALSAAAAPIVAPAVMVAGLYGTFAARRAFEGDTPRVLGQAPESASPSDIDDSNNGDEEEMTIHAATRRVHRRVPRRRRRRRETRSERG
ncbi:hypothetical protein V6Z98_006966 [Aspergillus fumigatus]